MREAPKLSMQVSQHDQNWHEGAAPKGAVEAKHERRNYVTVWLKHEDDQPVPAPAAGSEDTLRFFDRVSMARQRSHGKIPQNVKPLRCHCSVLVMAQSWPAKRPAVRNSG